MKFRPSDSNFKLFMTICFGILIALVGIPNKAAAGSSVQSPQCLGDSSWPIKIIYLHGLFTASGSDDNGFRVLEANNREKIAQLAQELKVRIAIPVAPVQAKRMRQWNGQNLKNIEKAAVQACGGEELADGRAIVGFSNGGYMARKIGKMDCAELRAYSRILAIGAPTTMDSGEDHCGKLFNKSPHVFPDMNYFAKNLSTL